MYFKDFTDLDFFYRGFLLSFSLTQSICCTHSSCASPLLICQTISLNQIKKIDENILKKETWRTFTKTYLYGHDKWGLSYNELIISSTIDFIVFTKSSVIHWHKQPFLNSHSLREKCQYLQFFWFIFPYSGNSISLPIHSKCGKIQTRKTPTTDTFDAVVFRS